MAAPFFLFVLKEANSYLIICFFLKISYSDDTGEEQSDSICTLD